MPKNVARFRFCASVAATLRARSNNGEPSRSAGTAHAKDADPEQIPHHCSEMHVMAYKPATIRIDFNCVDATVER